MPTAVSRRGWILGLLAGSMVWYAGYAAWWGFHGNATMPSKAWPVMTGSETVTASSMLAKLPLAFEPNRGQDDGRVLFASRNPGYSLFLTARGAVISLRDAARPLTLTWQGANPGPAAEGEAVLPGRHHYLRGDDPRRWRRDIPTYAKVRYRDLYPGIDLIYYGRQQHLEYDLVVAPGADPAAIRLGLRGMDALHLNQNGVLHIQMGKQALTLGKPVIYQEAGGAQRPVAGTYVLLADNQVGLELGDYDHSKPLIIDPVLSYSTYLGGGGLDQGKSVAVDSGGNVYVVGLTASGDFPVTGSPLQKANAGGDSDVFVAKFDPGGSLLFATYLGGSGADRGFGIAVDGSAL
ncbi:MAG: SBBP repeat-containing protein, partial [Gammaproteobacteria bacterium]